MNAIITAATGYNEVDLQPFLRSVDRACPDTKVFLIAYKSDAQRVETLRRQYSFIEPVYVPRNFNRGGTIYRWLARHFFDEDYLKCGPWSRSLIRYPLHIMLERFFLSLELIQAHRTSFANVLLTDSRDVVVQHNPFERVRHNVISGLEEKMIGDCSINSDWITDVYGPSVHSSVAGHKIVCSGVTLGPLKGVEAYLLAMSREIWRCLPKVNFLYDQAIHNYLIYSRKIDLELTDNRAGLIATLHHENPENFQTDRVNGIITVQGTAPAIVHQYDRHRSLVKFVAERSVDR